MDYDQYYSRITIPKHLNKDKTVSLYQEEIKICHYSYYLDEFYSNYVIDGHIPWFIRTIYSDNRNTNADKIKMTHEFILRFLTDEEYAKSIYGFYVVHVDSLFFAILEDVDEPELDEVKKLNKRIMLLQIGEGQLQKDKITKTKRIKILNVYTEIKKLLKEEKHVEFVKTLIEFAEEIKSLNEDIQFFLRKWDILDRQKLDFVVNRVKEGNLQIETDFLNLINNKEIKPFEENYYDKCFLIDDMIWSIERLIITSFDKFEKYLVNMCKKYCDKFPFIIDIFIKWVETDRQHFLEHKYTFFEEFKSSF